ncbi:MAG: hypothetical protein U0586_07490 [Candidatus Brocadiaceae bacterium]
MEKHKLNPMKIYITTKQQPRRYTVLWSVFVIFMCFAPFSCMQKNIPPYHPQHKRMKKEAWTGIDVSIVGKYATQYGRPPPRPIH